MKCATELESGVTLVMKVAALLIMGGLVPVPALHALHAIGAVLGQDHTHLPRGDEMTTLFLQGERMHSTPLLLDAHQRSLMKIRGDPILLPVEMMLIMVMRRGRPHLTAMDPLRAGGLPGRTQPRLLDLVPGLRMSLLPAATDCMVALLAVRCMQPVGAYIVPSHFAVSLARLNSLNLPFGGSVVLLGSVYRA